MPGVRLSGSTGLTVMVKNKAEVEPGTSAVEELVVDGFDHVEFYVGNALQASYYFQKGLGFDLVGYRGLETGDRNKVSYVMKQDHTFVVLSGAVSSRSDVAEHVHQHGDGVKTIAFRVKDARQAFDTAVARGAKSAGEPQVYQDEDGEFVSASIKTYGDTVHTFVERHNFKGVFAPGFTGIKKAAAKPVGLVSVDHVVGNVELGRMDYWANFYQSTFGFYVDRYFDKEDITTQYSALQSKVMKNKSGSVKMPINEPAEGLRRSQIQEYLDYYLAEGIQHVAITTRDIIATVAEMRQRGIEFLNVPRSYYDALIERNIQIDENLEELAQQGILIDSEDKGYLLQIFTKPIQDRPTFFFEVIQRKHGASGFGQGNFQALFEAIEREQAMRGNL
jgi:4-hydroxyphenylpyruvate dioxygenase